MKRKFELLKICAQIIVFVIYDSLVLRRKKKTFFKEKTLKKS